MWLIFVRRLVSSQSKTTFFCNFQSIFFQENFFLTNLTFYPISQESRRLQNPATPHFKADSISFKMRGGRFLCDVWIVHNRQKRARYGFHFNSFLDRYLHNSGPYKNGFFSKNRNYSILRKQNLFENGLGGRHPVGRFLGCFQQWIELVGATCGYDFVLL